MAISIPNRKARRSAVKSKHKETFTEWCKRISEAQDLGKRINGFNQEAVEISEMERLADSNASQLQDFIDKFGEEKGREMYNNNIVLRNKTE